MTEKNEELDTTPGEPDSAGTPPPEETTAEALNSLNETVEAGAGAAASAASQAESTALQVVDPPAARSGADEPAGKRYEKPTLLDRLASDVEYDPDATNDDRVMAALAYATQLLVPLVVPIIILLSETSKRRPFQRYHAIQSMAVAVVITGLELALFMAFTMSVASIILWLCLCFIFPAMIALWLVPLYYAILAYNGKRFRVPGLTQFLEDQRWL